MSAVKRHKVQSRLAAKAFEPGGVSIEEAMKRADLAVDQLRPPCLADLDVALADLDTRFGRSANGRDGEDVRDVYLLSSRIIDTSIGLPGSGIERAARALCEFIDVADDKGLREWESVHVHIDTLKLLRVAGVAMSKEQRDSVLEGLAKVARKRPGDTDVVTAHNSATR